MERSFRNNKSNNRYELHVDDSIAHVDYQFKENKIYLNATEVPKELGGQGIGSKLVKLVVEDIEQQGIKVVPICPFIVRWFEKNPDKNHLLA